jgi:hypothetical protein
MPSAGPTTLAFIAASAMLAGASALAGGALQDLDPPPGDLGRPLLHYATIARNDGSFRRFLVDEAALARIEPGRPLPEGTAIAMETFYGPEGRSTVFIKEKRGGAWLYGSFEPGNPDWTGMKAKTVCHACHIDAAEDLTFTLPSLAGFRVKRSPSRFLCDQSGRIPCDNALYETAGHP